MDPSAATMALYCATLTREKSRVPVVGPDGCDAITFRVSAFHRSPAVRVSEAVLDGATLHRSAAETVGPSSPHAEQMNASRSDGGSRRFTMTSSKDPVER
jgi:hypothetical protein